MGFDIDGFVVEQAHYRAIKRARLCFMAPPLGLPPLFAMANYGGWTSRPTFLVKKATHIREWLWLSFIVDF